MTKKLYRAMREGAGGRPEVGPTKRTLGVRPGDKVPNNDVQAVRPDEQVTPGTGGMSVAPDDPMYLPRFLRPAEFSGTGRDPVWELDEADLPPGLAFSQDKPTHGVIEPSRPLSLADYEQLLESTREHWRRVTPTTGEQS